MLSKYQKYRTITVLSVYYTFKYRLLASILPKRIFMQVLDSRGKKAVRFEAEEHDKAILYKRTSIVLRKLFPKLSCLIHSLVMKEVLNYYGINEYVHLGIKIIDGDLYAHAWVKEHNDFKKIYLL